MVSAYYTKRSRHITDLRESSKNALSLPDFSNVLWIGVFGSFCRDQQTDRSDIDIVVVERPGIVQCEAEDYEPWTLEDLLPRVWCRPVEIVFLKQELRELVAIDSLLTARTLYGDAKCAEVLQLRQTARRYLTEGWAIFKSAEKDIQALKSRIENVKDFDEFIKNPSLQQSLRDDLLKILRLLNIEPKSHPIYEGFWSSIIYPANEIKAIVTPNAKEDSEYWRAIWDILSASSPKGLQGLFMRLKKYVFPTLEDIENRIKRSEELENKEPRTTDIRDDGGSIPAAIETKRAFSKADKDMAVFKGGALKRRLKRLGAHFSRRDK